MLLRNRTSIRAFDTMMKRLVLALLGGRWRVIFTSITIIAVAGQELLKLIRECFAGRMRRYGLGVAILILTIYVKY
jgi:hypothetical protein